MWLCSRQKPPLTACFAIVKSRTRSRITDTRTIPHRGTRDATLLIQVKIKARPGAKKLSAMTPALPLKPLPPCVSGIGSDAGRGLAVCSCEGQCRIGLHCHTRKLNRHEHAFLENDTQTHVHWVKKGVMRLYKSLGNGRRQIVGFAFPGDFVGLGPDAKYLFSAQAVAATELRAVPKSEFEAIAREESRFSSKLFEAVSADQVRAYDLALTVGQRGSEAGLAAFLLEMHARTSEAESMDVLLQIPPNGHRRLSRCHNRNSLAHVQQAHETWTDRDERTPRYQAGQSCGA